MKIFSRLLPHSVDPLKLAVLGLALWSVLLGSCSPTPVVVSLHALQASERMSFVCRGDDNPKSGHALDECPDHEVTVTRRLIALITQTATNEIGLVDLAAQSLVDVDKSTPGFSFLRVGARPGAIVSTPGGAASFVGVSGLDKNGIFALPTTCLSAPREGQAALDLTTWSACHLSSAPGDITVVIDPVLSSDGTPREFCSPPPHPDDPSVQDTRECPADVTKEKGPQGRRKLLVALPDEHKLVLIDAQELLDRPPGEFDACVGTEFPLDAAQPATPPSPVLPPELRLPANAPPNDACVPTVFPHQDATVQTPGGMANAGDTVYVADTTAPVIHRIDVRDPCALQEQDPLLPYSYLTPQRTVTTSRVSVSPLTPTGKQYVYAIDQDDQPAASVMAFDVSPGTDVRTPIVFEGSTREPYLAPDRLRFGAPVRDVAFVMRDFPNNDVNTGAGQFGLDCSPFYEDDASPAALYRPSSDFTSGARPANLRGVFGFAMLTNGTIATIDVEDFDAPCRRPKVPNPFKGDDFRGCSKERVEPAPPPPYMGFYNYTTPDGADTSTPTVTDESTCNMIRPHRPRSAWLSVSSDVVGLHAPTLRSFPQFSNLDPTSDITAQQQPHMLAVDWPNPDPANTNTDLYYAQVNVNSTLFQHCTSDVTSNCLTLDPASSNAVDSTGSIPNSLTLPLVEPRSYAADESLTLTYEGKVFPAPVQDRSAGYLRLQPDGASATLNDTDAAFCSMGVQDADAIAGEATSLGIPFDAADPDKKWGTAHADYVQITGDFPLAIDSYWSVGLGAECKTTLNDKFSDNSHDACEAMFGDVIASPTVLKTNRDLSIIEAYSDHLLVAPRGCTGDDCALRLAQLRCCFPSATTYTVRASRQWVLNGTAGLSDMAAGPNDLRCVHTASCDLRKTHFHQRAFEVCAEGTSDEDGVCQTGNPNIGCAAPAAPLAAPTPTVPVPVVGPKAVSVGGPGSACIFENLTSRFVVYRGPQASQRGMSFAWQTTGGFTPMSMTMTSQTTSVNPQSIAFVPDLNLLAVVDGSTLGLVLFDLDLQAISLPSPYF